jgi:seryl-tRNA(Sec) selenium transferase
MEATLKLFLMPEKLEERHPLYRMLSLKTDALEKRARRVASRLRKSLPELTYRACDAQQDSAMD